MYVPTVIFNVTAVFGNVENLRSSFCELLEQLCVEWNPVTPEAIRYWGRRHLCLKPKPVSISFRHWGLYSHFCSISSTPGNEVGVGKKGEENNNIYSALNSAQL